MKGLNEIEGRRAVLAALMVFFSVISFYVLSEVFWTLFLAAAMSYMLYPAKEQLTDRGLSEGHSAGILTLAFFAATVLFIIPLSLLLFQRRNILIEFLTSLPDQFVIEFLDFEYVLQAAELQNMAVNLISDLLVSLVGSLPSLALKLFLFVFILYAVLKYSEAIEERLLGLFSDSSTDIIYSYNDRVKKTLIGIFAVQALTAVMTFVIALPVFYILGYEPFIALAVIAALLQFIPIAGPAFLIVLLAAIELSAGLFVKAAAILILGLVVVGFLPDAYLRPKMANRTTGLPASLYFVGFTGGALTIGAVGTIAGPLLIAVMLETVELLARE